MKKTQVKDATRNIRKRIVSYLSICLVIMLGVGMFLTTRFMEAGITREAAGYFKDRALKDFELISSLGASEANIDAIREVPGVTAAEGVMQYDGSIQSSDYKGNVTVYSRTEQVSVPLLTDGSYPSGAGECAIGEDFAEVSGIKVGDSVTIYLSHSGSDDPLKKHKFTVTGLVKHPDYVHRKRVNVVVLPLDSFDMSATENGYTRVFVKTEDVDYDIAFNQGYFDSVADTKASLEELAEELALARADEIKDEAYAEIDKEWEEAEAELADAQSEIDSNEAELNSKLADGRKQLEDAQDTLDKKISAATKKLNDGSAQIADAEKELKDAKKQLAANKKKLSDGKKELKAGKKALAKKEKELKEGKEALATAEEELEQKKALISQIKEALGGDESIDAIYEFAKEIKALIDNIDKSIADGDNERAEKLIKDLGQLIVDNRVSVKGFFIIIGDENVLKILNMIQKYTDTNFMKYINALNSIGYDKFMDIAEQLAENGSVETYKEYRDIIYNVADNIINLIDQLRDAEAKIAAGEKELAEGKKKIAAGEKEIAKAKKQIAAYEKEIAAGEKKIAAAGKKIKAGENKLKEKKKELAAGREKLTSEKAKAEQKIKNGWDKYYSEKAKYEAKLAEAKELLATNREEAEEKLAEARAEVEEIDCKWLVLDRNANEGYLDVVMQLDAMRSVGLVFGLLFMLITALVCFSTLTIIIEEQKKLIGTVKAFGFHKGEVLGKYLLFGVSAGVLGDLLALLTGIGLSSIVLKVYGSSNLYQYGNGSSIVKPLPVIIVSLVMIAICAVSSVIACFDILRSPASMLMKGQTLRGSKSGKRTTKAGSTGTLYSRLILRNMRDDKVRVIISTVIVGFCCMLIGVGVSFKLAFIGMIDKQQNDVNLYDIRVDVGDSVTEKERASVADVLAGSGVEYTAAMYDSYLFNSDGTVTGLTILAGDPDTLGDYVGLTESGTPVEIPSDGILVPVRMGERYGYTEGSSISIIDGSLEYREAEVTDNYTMYFGRVCITSAEGYEKIFGEEYEPNAYYVKLNGADAAALKTALLAVSEDISFESSTEFRASIESVGQLYNIIVYVTTGVAIFMSFMILTNLASIFLNRKKTELIVMRINGFSIKQTRSYLAREAILTTVVGLALGVIAGSLLSPFAVSILEPTDLQFDRSYHALAWVIAAGLEGLFAVVIYSSVFRRIKNLDFREIA